MDKNITETISILVMVLELLFNVWWALLFSSLGTKRKKVPVLRNMLAMWVILALVRIMILFDTEPLSNFLIPEPQNTLLFLLVGAGLLVFYLISNKRQHLLFIQKMEEVHTLEDLLTLPPSEFENMVVELYRLSGHHAIRTGSVGDNGVDIVVQAKNGEKWIVQCKRWRGSVGEPIVRDFFGAMHHARADRGTLITTGYFTKPALVWAKGKPLTLYDGKQLVEIWKKAQSKRPTIATAKLKSTG